MRDTRCNTTHRPQRWATILLPILCCAAAHAQKQKVVPEGRIPVPLAASMNVSSEQTPSQVETAPQTTSAVDPLSPTFVESKCGDVLSTPGSVETRCRNEQDPFSSFPESPAPQPMTPRQKAILAGKGVIDPFNLLTTGSLSAISIGANAESPYGPGLRGWARLSGVSLTQDMTHEFELSRWRDGRCCIGCPPAVVGGVSLGS